MGQATIFYPPPIHKSNLVILPAYLQRSRLKQLARSIQGTFLVDQEGLVTVMNDQLEFHYKLYHRHIELVELAWTLADSPDVKRCMEFLRYEAYLFQKPIYCTTDDPGLLPFLKDEGFRIIEDESERRRIYQEFWEAEEKTV